MERARKRNGFTLVELLVVVAIIALLISILLPSLGRARESAKSATCLSYLRTFGNAFEIYANQNNGVRCSGAFDYLRDGDVRSIGWVADVVNSKIGVPGKMLCPTNRFTINEKVADYTGAATTGKANKNRHSGGVPTVPIVPVGVKSVDFWAQGYNSNYATTWQFSRGDPTADDGYGSDGVPESSPNGDPSKCPLDGDGPLNEKHLNAGIVQPARVALMGDSRAGDAADSMVTQAYADAINNFADEKVIDKGDYTVESFTDGMSVDYSSVTGNAGQKGHEFNDIVPLHNADSKEKGGFANLLFADGHAGSVKDSGGLNDAPDGFIGPYKNASGVFEINSGAFKEVRSSVWYGRLRSKALPGGGSVE